MSLTLCTCTLNVKDSLRANYTTAELIWEPRKSMVDSGTGLYISKPQRVTADSNGLCTIILAQTTTDAIFGIFSLNWNDGSNYGTIIFDPVQIPNQASVDLSTILTVSRG